LMFVDTSFPRIIPELLLASMSANVASRIEQISYQVNLEGLGDPEGSAAYKAVLGDLQLCAK
jgi:hypothetical protein